MTRKHFQAIANILNAVRPPIECDEQWRMWQRTVARFTRMCKEQNPRFDTQRFLLACGCEAARLLNAA